MQFKITLDESQYSALMVAIAYTEVTLKDGDFVAKLGTVKKHIIETFEN